MKKDFSPKWISSVQPRKQRKYVYNAPMHVRQQLVSSHLDKVLRKQFKTRSIPVRKDDEIIVMRGEYRGRTGKVSRVDLKKLFVYIDNIKRKKPSGQEVEVPVQASNLMITKLGSDDKERMKALVRKQNKGRTPAQKQEAKK